MSTSPAECVNRYRKARRTADAILASHADIRCTIPVTTVAARMDDHAWELAAGRPVSATTKALVMELLREHESSHVAVSA